MSEEQATPALEAGARGIHMQAGGEPSPAGSLSPTAKVVIRRDSTVRRSLAIADCVSLLGALVVSAEFLGDGALTWATIAVLPALVMGVKIVGLYDRDANLLHKTTLDELPTLLWLTGFVALLVWLAGDLVVEPEPDRAQVASIWGVMFALMASGRASARYLARRISPVERCLLVGERAEANELRTTLVSNPALNAELVGWLPTPDASSNELGAGLAPQIRAVADAREIHRVVLGPGPAASEELLNSIRQIEDIGLKVSVLPRTARLSGSSVELDRLNGITLMGVRKFHITTSSKIVKRTFDVVGSVMLLALGIPVFLAISLAVKLSSRGPVLFRQRRAGRGSEPFEMLKFRSMVDGSEDRQAELHHLSEGEGVFKMSNDPRVTRVGRSLRRLSLDELPQLVNVLRGEMSLVGPRPLPLEEDQRIAGWHRRRLDLRPGMTGYWQVLGSARIPVREMVQLDNQYVAEWSLWGDLKILLLTIPHVIGRRGV